MKRKPITISIAKARSANELKIAAAGLSFLAFSLLLLAFNLLLLP